MIQDGRNNLFRGHFMHKGSMQGYLNTELKSDHSRTVVVSSSYGLTQQKCYTPLRTIDWD